MPRIIPTTMATQHPDHAAIPYWSQKPFISTSAELKECYLTFSELGIDEYNWDWEGKFVDEAVVDRLLHRYYSYFQHHPLGKEKYLTFRLPNPRVERQFRLARAFMVMVTSSQLAKSYGFEQAPVFETILPLTETADEIVDIQKAFRDLVSLEHHLLKMEDSLPHIELIPLFEQVSTMMRVGEILRTYLLAHKTAFGETPVYIRPYMARSDPALNSGIVPTMLALKVALSSCLEVEKETGVVMYPMVGTGALPFRGGVSPDRIKETLKEYAGVKTLTVQSAFRYDYPLSKVHAGVAALKEGLPLSVPLSVTVQEKEHIDQMLSLFEEPYRYTIEHIAPLINQVSAAVPKRRERIQHVGLFGYSRGVGSVQLPRAIPFTASLYTLGIPPELIGTGRGLKEVASRGMMGDLTRWYLNIRHDMISAGRFLDKSHLASLAKTDTIWQGVYEDVLLIEKILEIELGASSASEKRHCSFSKKAWESLEDQKTLGHLIESTGILRKSLG